MGMKSFKEKLVDYMNACIPIIFVDTLKDDIYEKEIIELAKKREPKLKVVEWSETGFLEKADGNSYTQYTLFNVRA